MLKVLLFSLFVGCVVSHTVNPLSHLNMNNLKKNLDDTIQLSVTPSVIPGGKSGWVTVTFSGVQNPQSNDFIGVYSPASADTTLTAPIKYQFASYSNGYNITGSGSFKFYMLNMWSDYQFRFFRNGTNFPVLASVSNLVTFENPKAPLQGHLAVTGDPTEMRVSWASPDNSGNQQVQWGIASGELTNTLLASTTTYSASDMCGSPATDFGWRDPGFLHTVILRKLTPGTKYYYRYGNDKVTGFSEESTFTAAPVVNADAGIEFIAYGDMGKGEIDGSLEHWEEQSNSVNTTKSVIGEVDNIDMVLHIGDISYAVGYSSQWNEFMAQVEPIASKVPYMTGIGNHEMDFPNSPSLYNGTDSGGECGVPYSRRFTMPSTGYRRPWYSFNYGNVHFLVMSTEHDFFIGSEQYNFIADDLNSVDRSITPWVIFSGHRPMYIDSILNKKVTDDQPVAKQLRENIEFLLYKHRVHLALWGHNHTYQRMCPVYKEICGDAKDFTTHVVIGMAGFNLDHLFQPTAPNYAVVLDNQNWGYSKIKTTATTLEFQFIGNSGEGVLDHFSLSL